MKILIFGATGSIGRHVVKQALDRKYKITAFTRSPQKLHDHSNLNIVQGDVLDYEDVRRAFNKPDAVICTLGAGSKGRVRSEGTRNIIRAMEQTGVKRLICLSTLGAGDSRESLNFFWKYIMFGFLLRKAFADHQKQEQYIRETSLDWTIVRPAAFTDGPLTRKIHHGFESDTKELKLKISRADVAWFMLEQLSNNTYFCKTPGISY